MIEILVVVAILGVLFALLLMSLGAGQMGRARDAERKDDLQSIKVAFEEYYNDNGCYPAADILSTCGSSELSPYLSAIPCDPSTNMPYVYVPHPDNFNTCRGYRVYAALEYDADPVIHELGCVGGCGIITDSMLPEGDLRSSDQYNYGVSEGVPVGGGTNNPGGSVYTSCCPAGGGVCNAYSGNPTDCQGGRLYETYEQCLADNNGCSENGY